MSYRTILVSLNDVDRVSEVLNVAAKVAKAFEAHVEGLFVIPAPRIYPVATMAMPPEVFEKHREAFEEMAENVHGQFRDFLEREGLNGEWRLIESPAPIIADVVIDAARRCDLVIASQPPEEETAAMEADFAERLVMESGRPVLFVPREGTFETVGEIIVAGWNGSREAARAVHDALPFLTRAKDVRIAWIDPQKNPQEAGDLPGAELADALARHGAPVAVDALVSGGLDAGEVLLNHVADTGADLLVMGAWGHSRLREYVFGGATQHVMEHMTVPVLFSH
ncbi:universal stress protein [Thermopetrobacter sp. TC1]|uniref:universal stress protein n=1 Tax=Thermopetrobacter sp. TC1 TaxID=1495045 RepID=UPI00056DDC7A|nr:universal stress protein [Thermopetrobacter sp. TC1]